MLRWRAAAAVCVAPIAIALGGTATAPAAIVLGETFPPTEGSCAGNGMYMQASSPGSRYTVPSDGVITSWTVRGSASPQPMAFKILRPVGEGRYHAVGSSATHTPPANGLFTGNLGYPVKAGDVFGLFIQTQTGCRRDAAGHHMLTKVGDHLFDTEATYGDPRTSQLNASAVLEPDADKDGLGDESQDPDDDADGRNDAADNCPAVANPDQANADGAGDGGDACDLDDDDDGYSDAEEAFFGLDPRKADTDDDGSGDRTDNCAAVSNPGQADFDQDGPGDACDPLSPGTCANSHVGTELAETITGTVAGDRITALGGKDTVNGLAGADCLDGGTEDDKLNGGDGNDRLDGRGGADRLSGGSGDDKLTGGTDADTLKGGPGKNSYSAGDGKDSVNSVNGNREKVDCGPGVDKVTADTTDRLKNCERIKRRK